MEDFLFQLGICVAFLSPLFLFQLFFIILAKIEDSQPGQQRRLMSLVALALIPLLTTSCYVSYLALQLVN